jgi:hypothetical protein
MSNAPGAKQEVIPLCSPLYFWNHSLIECDIGMIKDAVLELMSTPVMIAIGLLQHSVICDRDMFCADHI